eukprot:TRINITY_DN24052_c0_g1_i1.p1 TRINITY_DN24052_c0_g1~~TRINITY_DN24052_c0_g1_i1.p1  ORF type:complete len:722 (+),score=206.07 TRINITY_DN24052_c0_g1_i1:48-2213(+)
MYVEEWRKTRAKERQIERLKAVRKMEKDRAAEQREKAAAAAVLHEMKCKKMMESKWQVIHEEEVTVARKKASDAAEATGKAHRDAKASTTALQARAENSHTAWEARHKVHASCFNKSLLSVRKVREDKQEKFRDASDRRARVAATESSRSHSAVATHHKRTQKEEQLLRNAQSQAAVRPVGLQLMKNSKPLRVDDYKTSGYHKILVSGKAAAYPSEGGACEVWGNVAPDKQGVPSATVQAKKEAEATRKLREAEKKKLREFKELEKQRAYEIKQANEIEEEEKETVIEMALAKRKERREKITNLTVECRHVEYQQSQMRKTSRLETQLQQDFEKTFIRPDLDWKLSDVTHHTKKGNDTAVLQAKNGRQLKDVVGAEEVSQHLRELFELSGQQHEVALPCYVAEPSSSLSPQLSPAPTPAPAPAPIAPQQVYLPVPQESKIEHPVPEHLSVSNPEIGTLLAPEQGLEPQPVLTMPVVETEVETTADIEVQPDEPSTPAPIQHEPADNSSEPDATLVTDPDVLESCDEGAKDDPFKTTSQKMASLRVDIKGLQERLQQLFTAVPRHEAKEAPAEMTETMPMEEPREVATEEATRAAVEVRFEPPTEPVVNGDGWIQGGYSPNPSSSSPSKKSDIDVGRLSGLKEERSISMSVDHSIACSSSLDTTDTEAQVSDSDTLSSCLSDMSPDSGSSFEPSFASTPPHPSPPPYSKDFLSRNAKLWQTS